MVAAAIGAVARKLTWHLRSPQRPPRNSSSFFPQAQWARWKASCRNFMVMVAGGAGMERSGTGLNWRTELPRAGV